MSFQHNTGIDSTTRRLVDFALAYRFEDLPASTVHAAKARLLDSIAVGLAAWCHGASADLRGR